MGADGHAILVSTENLNDIVTEIFIQAYINKFHPQFENCNFIYENENENELLYSVSIECENSSINIEVDLSEYKSIMKSFREHTFMCCQRDIPDLSDYDNYKDEIVPRVEYIESLNHMYEIYYWDTELIYGISDESLIYYMYFKGNAYCDNTPVLKRFVHNFVDVDMRYSSKKERKLFAVLFNNPKKLVSIIKKIIDETDLDIREEFIWT